MFNAAGLIDIFDVDTLSLHTSNPGTGVNPAAGEITGAPYARQAVTFAAKTTGTDGSGLYARANLAAAATFGIALGAEQSVQFVGLWKGGVYKGYRVPTAPKVFNDPDSTARNFVLSTAFAIEQRNQP